MNRKTILSNLTVKMIVLVMAIHLCLLNIIYFGLGTVIEEGYQSQFVDYVRADAFNFAANMSGHKNLSESINTPAIEEAVLSGRTVFLRVLDKDDNIVKSFGEISKDYHFVEDYKFGHSQLDIYNIAAPLNNQDGEYFGQLQIGYDESGTREQIELAYQRCLLFSMIYTVCAFVITIYFGQRMTRPIQALQRLTRSIAHGQYQTEISVNTNVKEIKSLADTVEFMREELVSQTDSMEHLALHDNLTGLPNRVLLQDRVNQTITCRLRGAESCVLAVIDLDRFKEINDSFGHLTGDSVLKQASVRLVAALRKSDTVARLGGDEFAIFFPETSLESAISLGNKIVSELCRPFACDNHSVSLGASLGLACFPIHGESYEMLLRRADVAMYAAKKSETNVQVYQSHFDQDALARLTLVSDLRAGIENDQLFAVFQPKINLVKGDVSGAELLIRWNHPDKGIIPPHDFISSAERSGVISQITQWVLREGIKQAAIWYKKGLTIPVAINLSPKNLTEDALFESVLEMLEQYQLPAHLLELEITESSVFADPLRAKEILESLHSIGIKIAIDDFGTGYSSLAQLRKMPVSVLKIDRSFVRDMHSNASDEAIVSATIYMAHKLGLKVVAEGVEDESTLDKLRELNCDVVQGYYFARPMPVKQFEQWLKSTPIAQENK